MCGEKLSNASLVWSLTGSPPRVRGKGSKRPNNTLRPGITPACAGKSMYHTISSGCYRDHPRVCGEKGKALVNRSWNLGSPPRVRGKVRFWPKLQKYGGITPACAGKSEADHIGRGIRQDHPRVCGEKMMRWKRMDRFKGSPPRVRGKGRSMRQYRPTLGITPACAGKRHKAVLSSGRNGDHPRVCGEKTASI